MQLKDWLPLIGVVVGVALGWFLTQLGQWLVLRREEKKAISRALSELLEIRHRFLAIPKAVEFLSQHFPIPPDGQMAMKVALARLFPPDVDLAKRYGEAVSLVAGCNPILGFRLRSQDLVSPLFDTLRQMALADSQASIALLSKLERELMGQLKPHLEQLLRELAWMHGSMTWWDVRCLLKRPLEIPESLLQSLKAGLPPLEQKAPGTGSSP